MQVAVIDIAPPCALTSAYFGETPFPKVGDVFIVWQHRMLDGSTPVICKPQDDAKIR